MIRDHRYRVELVKVERETDLDNKKEVLRVRNKDNTINFTTEWCDVMTWVSSGPRFFYGRVVGNQFELLSPSIKGF